MDLGKGFLSMTKSDTSKLDMSNVEPESDNPNYNPHNIRITASYGAPL